MKIHCICYNTEVLPLFVTFISSLSCYLSKEDNGFEEKCFTIFVKGPSVKIAKISRIYLYLFQA